MSHKKDSEIILSTEDIMFEEIMLALRMDKGLNIDKFNKKFNVDFVSKYKKALALTSSESGSKIPNSTQSKSPLSNN